MSEAAPPEVSVVMPLFNAEAYVAQAVQSILCQTLEHWELIVVDDGSTDRSREVVARFDDPRIRLHVQASNTGISRALNTGIGLARAELIARMDADDVCAPDRLARQVSLLGDEPSVVAVGCSLDVIDSDGRPLHPYWVLTRDLDLRAALVMQGPFAHGSAIYRRSAYEAAGGYEPSEEPAEDYALWLRLAEHGRIVNLPERLYSLRVSDRSVSARNRVRQLQARERVRQAARTRLGEVRLSSRELVRGRRFYASLDVPEAEALERRFVEQYQELAALDAARRGLWPAVGNVARAALLGWRRPRTLRRMYRFYDDEREGLRRDWV